MASLKPETRVKFKTVSTATLCTALYKKGLRQQFIQDVHPLSPETGTMVGEAFTLRYIPAREDLNGPGEYEDHHPQRRAIEECPPGAVLVADCRRDVRAACGGDILLTRLATRGVGGMVTDGGMRDVVNIAKLAMPVYIGAPSAPASFHGHAAIDANVPIACGDVPVYPGDVLVGDCDGVIVIPRHLADEVARDSIEQERLEAWVLDEVRAGHGIFGLYPPNEATRARYEATRKE
jgi:regulator of RNase E activity RraA